MFESTTIVTFVLVVLALFLVPGPAVLLTLTQSIAGGRRVGLATSLGIATGDAMHTLLAALGLSAVLMTSALAFSIVKYAGAAYLIYLGIRAWRTSAAESVERWLPRIEPRRAFRQAFLTEALNPKTALFFLAFLPQFVDPVRGAVISQILILGLIFVVLSICYTTLLALAAGSLGPWLTQRAGIARWQGKVSGTIFIGLGIRLALQRQA